MNRLEAMSTLLAAVDAGSLSAASRALGVPLPTVSRRVSDLEAYLKTRLLIRTSRRLELTDAGRSYVAACREILASVGVAERRAMGEYANPVGELTVSAPIVFGRLHILPVVVAFLDTYPEIDVQLVLTDRIVDFVEDRIDVALRIGPLPDSSLIAARVGEVRMVACASPAYLAAREPLVEPGDLSAHPCITFHGRNSPSEWTFRRGRADLPVPIRSRLVVNTAEAAIDAAASGLGVTRVLSYQIADALRVKHLTEILSDFEPEPYPVSLVYAEQGLLPLKTRAFVDFAKDRLVQRIDRLGAA